MREGVSKILVTGGAGFIGSEFIRQLIKKRKKLVVVDKLTYAGDLERLKKQRAKFSFYKTDICSPQVESVFKKEKPSIVVNFAAESHVDRSIKDSSSFVETNIKGTQNLLDISRKHEVKKFIHISTDEVYGEIKKGKFNENSSLHPNSPYASSKAAADLFIKAYVRTYNFPAIIVRPCNNYGPWQYPEKLIPVVIFKALSNEKVPLYGKGENVREWLFVSDCAQAIYHVMKKGKIGKVYNIGSNSEKKNIDLVRLILKNLKKPESLIEFVEDRLGHDYRYSLDFSKMRYLGWKPKTSFNSGMKLTIDWYCNNTDWLKAKVKNLRSYWSKFYKPC